MSRSIGYTGLTVDFARQHGVNIVVRGLRAVSDFEFEFQLANMTAAPAERDIETVFLTPQEQFTFISSTLIREIAVYGGNVSEFVDPMVAAELRKKKRWHEAAQSPGPGASAGRARWRFRRCRRPRVGCR